MSSDYEVSFQMSEFPNGHATGPVVADPPDSAGRARLHQSVLNDLLRMVLEDEDVVPLLTDCLRRLVRLPWLAQPGQAALLWLDEDGYLRPLAQASDHDEGYPWQRGIPVNDALFGQSGEEATAHYRPALTEEQASTAPVRLSSGSHYVIPLVARQRLLGVMLVCVAEDHHPEREYSQFLGAVADVFALFLQRWQQEQALLHSQQRLHQAQLTGRIGTWEGDISQDLIQLSPEGAHILGCPGGRLSFQGFRNLIHPEDLARVRRSWWMALAQGNYDVEYRILVDGQARWIHASAEMIRDAQGQVVRAIGIVQDLSSVRPRETLTRAAQRDLAHQIERHTDTLVTNEARWNLALEWSGVGVWDWNVATGEVFFSTQWKSMLGYCDDEIDGRLEEWQSRIHPEDYPHYQLVLQEHLYGDAPRYVHEHRLRCQNGTWKWVCERGAVVVRADDGEPLRVIGTQTDVTERRHSEEQLVHATQTVDAANRAKSAFLANISHEIRTPLHAILGLAQIGQSATPGTVAGETFEQIHASGRHLLCVVDDLLDFSRLESRAIQAISRPFEFAPLVQRCVESVLAPAREGHLTLHMQIEREVPAWLETDPAFLSKILTNLLTNAVKFTEQGEVRLEADCQDGEVHIRVRDTGPGIGEEQRARLFVPFEQVDDSTTREHGGAGLGLAISQRLTQLIGGRLEVASVPGEGSTFTLILPRGASSAPAPQEAVAGGAPARMAGLRVLAVEDNEVNQMVLEGLLEGEGIELTLANDGAQAVEEVRRQGGDAFDLVLMDVQMPVMDGYEATRRIRALVPDLPVIGLTAHALPEERDRCLASGMNDHLSKPFVLAELLEVMRLHLRHFAPGAEDPTLAESPDAPAQSAGEAPQSSAGMEAERLPPAHLHALLDWASLLEKFGGREAFVLRLLTTMQNSHVDTPQTLREIAQRQDFGQLGFIAHTIKGTASNLEAAALQDLAARTEQAARQEQPQAVDLALELAQAMTQMREAILDYISATATEGERS